MSLGLVAYDDSEESGNESDSEDNKSSNKNVACSKVASVKAPRDDPGQFSDEELDLPNTVNGSAHIDDEERGTTSSLDKSASIHLPESKLSLINTDFDIKCLTSTSRKNGPVKITIPSLNEVIDESEPPTKKKLKPSQKGSGLFALLPTPKSTLVPQSVTNKKPLTPATKKPTPVARPTTKITPKLPIAPKTSSLISYEDSGDEDESSETIDFFSLDSKDQDLPAVDVSIDIPLPETSSSIRNDKQTANASSSSSSTTPEWQKAPSTGWTEAQSSQEASSSYPADTQPNFGYSTSEFMSVSNNELTLDQQAMQQLCGRRDRLKMQEVNLIDVSGDAIMPDSREWLTKQLTEEVVHRPSHKRKDGPTSQQKRKHQITYLAYQAKENELELKNQWANNRMSRKQTQAKYGF